MSKIFFGFTLLASALHLVAADGLFVGCYSNYPQSSVTDSFLNVDSGTDCAAACAGSTYSYYTSPGDCFCSDTSPAPTDLQTGNPGTDCTDSGFEARVVKTTFDATECVAESEGFTTDAAPAFDVASPQACLSFCANSQKAIFFFNNNKFLCGCGNQAAGATATCGRTTYFLLNHPADASASGLARRNAREAFMSSKKNSAFNGCPGTLTACLIPGLEKLDAWECVDTQNDLESCGGCLAGTYKDADDTVGESCTKPGVKLGAATCASGKCVISECKVGFELVDNECIRLN